MGITYSECVCVFVALGIQHAIRVRRIILPSVACPALQYRVTIKEIDTFNVVLKRNY